MRIGVPKEIKVREYRVGLVPASSLPFVLALADHGLEPLRRDRQLMAGLNVHRGHITNAPVAKALGHACTDAAQALAA